MGKFATERAREFYAQTYDARVTDWPGEIDFYRELARRQSWTVRLCWRLPAGQDVSPYGSRKTVCESSDSISRPQCWK